MAGRVVKSTWLCAIQLEKYYAKTAASASKDPVCHFRVTARQDGMGGLARTKSISVTLVRARTAACASTGRQRIRVLVFLVIRAATVTWHFVCAKNTSAKITRFV
eukprot:XP_003248850.2 PREDICTED: uncharacterized protein LOC100569924 [Acyrthosiphon pisum]